MRRWTGVLLLGLIVIAASAPARAQNQFVIFKTKTPFDAGKVIPDSARLNDFYVRIGSDRGAQIGMTMNVYRDKDLISEIGSFKFKTTQFIGRVRIYDAQREFTITRVVELASHGDPHLDRTAVMVGDYVQPVFVIEAENLFDKGSGTLRPEAIRELDRAVTFISRFKPLKVRIEGHTDSDGPEDVNMQLSESRARSVQAYLVSQGSIDENVLIPVGYGETKPIASNDTPEGQRTNRRFEIVIEQ
jgi:outer membrane protein OmpA-like peptidoglycan-associated protein